MEIAITAIISFTLGWTSKWMWDTKKRKSEQELYNMVQQQVNNYLTELKK